MMSVQLATATGRGKPCAGSGSVEHRFTKLNATLTVADAVEVDVYSDRIPAAAPPRHAYRERSPALVIERDSLRRTVVEADGGLDRPVLRRVFQPPHRQSDGAGTGRDEK